MKSFQTVHPNIVVCPLYFAAYNTFELKKIGDRNVMNINECQIHRAINSVSLISLPSEGIKRYARY